jgi:hypothetical protein
MKLLVFAVSILGGLTASVFAQEIETPFGGIRGLRHHRVHRYEPYYSHPHYNRHLRRYHHDEDQDRYNEEEE